MGQGAVWAWGVSAVGERKLVRDRADRSRSRRRSRSSNFHNAGVFLLDGKGNRVRRITSTIVGTRDRFGRRD
jgi:hypothetical protein